MDARLSGIVCVNQQDDPWWMVATLSWLARYEILHTAPTDLAQTFRATYEKRCETEGPGVLYSLFTDFEKATEAEARLARTKSRTGGDD